MLLKSGGGEGLAKYCILDRDYHTADEINERYKSSKEHRINLHIWSKKEIANYLLLPTTITRHVNNMKRKGRGVKKEDVERVLDAICEGLRDETLDLISEEYIRRNRPKNAAAEGNKHARREIRARWISLSGKLAIVSGKSVLSQISSWAQSNYGVSLNAYVLAKSAAPEELDSKLISVMTALETGSAFPTVLR